MVWIIVGISILVLVVIIILIVSSFSGKSNDEQSNKTVNKLSSNNVKVIDNNNNKVIDPLLEIRKTSEYKSLYNNLLCLMVKKYIQDNEFTYYSYSNKSLSRYIYDLSQKEKDFDPYIYNFGTKSNVSINSSIKYLPIKLGNKLYLLDDRFIYPPTGSAREGLPNYLAYFPTLFDNKGNPLVDKQDVISLVFDDIIKKVDEYKDMSPDDIKNEMYNNLYSCAKEYVNYDPVSKQYVKNDNVLETAWDQLMTAGSPSAYDKIIANPSSMNDIINGLFITGKTIIFDSKNTPTGYGQLRIEIDNIYKKNKKAIGDFLTERMKSLLNMTEEDRKTTLSNYKINKDKLNLPYNYWAKTNVDYGI